MLLAFLSLGGGSFAQSQGFIDQRRSAFDRALNNAVISMNSAGNRHLKLRNGEFKDDSSPARALFLKISKPVVFARVSARRREVALVPMVLSSVGSGIFSSLNVFRFQHGRAQQIAFAELGDRIRIDSIYVEHDTICVAVITQGPNEPMCCPTMPFTFHFQLHAGRLVQMNSPNAK